MTETASPPSRAHQAAKRYIYAWGGGHAEGDATMRDLLGGKGAGLAEMTNAGLPVPPGFTITTEACNDYFAAGERLPDGLWEDVLEAVREVERETGKGFGDPADPLLVSVRSGAKFSMPGMMDTVLNLGLNEATLHGLIELTGNERFGWDAYRRFIQMFGRIVLGVDGVRFDHAFDATKHARGAALDTDLDAGDLRDAAAEFREIVRADTGREFPEDPYEQLDLAIKAVFASWFGKRARDYREYNKIAHDLGTAVNVVTMVFGNMGDDSGTGVAFTRDPNTGEKVLFGEYLTNAQGEDVVAGIRTPRKIAEMGDDMPDVYGEFERIAERLERHYRDVQDLEFTIERGRLYMLQTRSAKRTAAAAVRIAVDMVDEGHHHEARGARADRAGPRRPAAARPVRPRRAPGRHAGREGPQRLAGRGRRAGRLLRRRRRGLGRARREGRPRPHRDLAGRLPRHGRRPGHPHRPRRRDVARSGRRPADRQALRGRLRRAARRLRREDGPQHRLRRGLRRGRLDQPRRLDRGGLRRLRAHGLRPLRGPARPPDGPRLGRRGPAPAGLDERRQARGGRPGAQLRRAGHRPLPHRAHVPRGRAAGHRARRHPRRLRGDPGQGAAGRGRERSTPTRRRSSAASTPPWPKLEALQQGDFEGIFRAMDGLPVVIRLIDPPLHEFLPDARGAAGAGGAAADARHARGRSRVCGSPNAARRRRAAARAEPDARPARLSPGADDPRLREGPDAGHPQRPDRRQARRRRPARRDHDPARRPRERAARDPPAPRGRGEGGRGGGRRDRRLQVRDDDRDPARRCWWPTRSRSTRSSSASARTT